MNDSDIKNMIDYDKDYYKKVTSKYLGLQEAIDSYQESNIEINKFQMNIDKIKVDKEKF